MKKIAVLIIIMSFINVSVVFAQKKYSKLDEKESVVLSYKWKPSKFCKKNSPLVLLLKIENRNEYAVQTDFVVDYFWETLRKASSPNQSFCIKAGKIMKGRLDKLGFDRSKFSNKDIMSEKFIMEVSGVKVTKTKECTKK